MLTVNYDTALERGLPPLGGIKRFPIAHAEIAHEARLHMLWNPEGRLLNGRLLRQLCVVHLHGLFYDRSNSYGFTLTRSEYECPAAALAFLAFLLTGVSGAFRDDTPLSLVFIGCKDTVVDRHFRALWVAQGALRDGGWFAQSRVTEPEHFWLVAAMEVAYAESKAADILACTGVVVHVVCYGDFSELAAFVSELGSE